MGLIILFVALYAISQASPSISSVFRACKATRYQQRQAEAMRRSAYSNQLASLRKPPIDLGSLRSSYDFDGIAADAVEGRSNHLEFYRKRPPLGTSYS